MRSLDLCDFDNVCVNPMSHRLETARIATEAGLFTRLALRTTMAIDTLNVIAFQSETTRCHTSNGRQDM